jgi:hypothetical protein
MLNTLHTIVHKNYLRFNDKFYKLSKDVAMDSSISDFAAETFLPYFENNHKNITESNHIFYTCYADDILINYNHIKITPQQILHYVNTIHTNLQFQLTFETEASINFLELIVHRTNQGFEIVYRKLTFTYTTIHYNSDHPTEHKSAPFAFFWTDHINDL